MSYIDRLAVFAKRNRRIKRLYNDGNGIWTQAGLARRYGISRERVRQIVNTNGAKS